MSQGTFSRLDDRAVVEVRGEGANEFVAGLATVELSHLSPGTPRHGALLTPQGKILFDFGLHQGEESLLLDVAAEARDDLVKRLMFYRLRLKLDIAPRGDLSVFASWGGEGGGPLPEDPRLPALGGRGIRDRSTPAVAIAAGADAADPGSYHRHRIACGVTETFRDFPGNDVFPHEANLDLLHSVDFDKGCYVGQEVVSRMHHRGTAKKRFLIVDSEADLPAPGAEIRDGETLVGTLGSSSHGQGLALLRLDRTADALAAGRTISCQGMPLRPRLPDWMPPGLLQAPSEERA